MNVLISKGVTRLALALIVAGVATHAMAAKHYWLCVSPSGVKGAQDQPCAEGFRTLRAPAGYEEPSTGPDLIEGGAQAPAPARPAESEGAPEPLLEAVQTQPRKQPALRKPYQPIVHSLYRVLPWLLLGVIVMFTLSFFSSGLSKQRGRSARPSRRPPTNLSNSPGHQAPPLGPMPPNSSTPAPASWSAQLLQDLDWRRFELLAAAIWRARGHRVEEQTGGADGGVDFRVYQKDAPARLWAVAQCKSWRGSEVGVEPVRALWGVCAHFNAEVALFYGLPQFTSAAREFSNNKALRLFSSDEVLAQIAQLPTEAQAQLLQDATRGDYRTPSCPGCLQACVVRTNQRDGNQFWGCRNYPRRGCHSTFVYRQP